MSLRTSDINLSCPVCSRASYLWSNRDISDNASLWQYFTKGTSRAYCPTCGISFRVNVVQIFLSLFRRTPLQPLIHSNEDPEATHSKLTTIPHRHPLEISQSFHPEIEEEPSGIHLKVRSKTLGLKIEMSVTGGKLPQKIAPAISKAIEGTSSACSAIYALCKEQCKSWSEENKARSVDQNIDSDGTSNF